MFGRRIFLIIHGNRTILIMQVACSCHGSTRPCFPPNEQVESSDRSRAETLYTRNLTHTQCTRIPLKETCSSEYEKSRTCRSYLATRRRGNRPDKYQIRSTKPTGQWSLMPTVAFSSWKQSCTATFPSSASSPSPLNKPLEHKK